jgi:hypothetical protein
MEAAASESAPGAGVPEATAAMLATQGVPEFLDRPAVVYHQPVSAWSMGVPWEPWQSEG